MRYLSLLGILLFMQGCVEKSVDSSQGFFIIAEPPIEVYSKDNCYVAFCDAVKFEGKYYCVFREGENHAPYHEWHTNGYLKIISSTDLENWVEELDFRDSEWDLRDPCFCVSDDCLYLYYGYYSFENPDPEIKTGVSLLAVSDGKLYVDHSEKVDIGDDSHLWLWKIYYEDGQFYGAAYSGDTPIVYVTSEDGVHFKKESEIIETGTETSIALLNDKRKIAVIRNNTSQGKSHLAISVPPYTQWNSYDLNEMIESPESFIYKGDVYVVGRSYYGMSMFKLDLDMKRAVPVYNFFVYGEYGNCGYPGIIAENQRLSVFYYSVNPDTERTSIYLTKMVLPQ